MMRLRVMLKASFAALAISLVAAACGSSANPTAPPTNAPIVSGPTATPRPTTPPVPTNTPAPAGSLTVAISDFSLDSFNTAVASGGFPHWGMEVFDFLVWHNKEGDLAPGVAQSWEMAPDGKSWVFNIRSMRFSDGSNLTAEDVKHSLDYNAQATVKYVGAAPWVANYDHTDVSSPTQAKLFTKNPAPLSIFTLAPRSAALSGVILSKTAMTAAGTEKYFNLPVASGPWRVTAHETGVRFAYEPSSVQHAYRGSPRYAKLELLRIAEESTRLANLKTGQTQVGEISPSNIPTVKGADLQILDIPATATVGLYFPGNNNPTLFAEYPTSKLMVRQALGLAINRQEIINFILSGVGQVPARDAITPSAVGYDPTWKAASFDAAKAKQMLSEAGYPNGFEITLHSFPFAGSAWLPDAIQAIAGYWSAVGVKAKITPGEFGSLAQNFRKRPQDRTIVGAALMFPVNARQEPLSGLSGVYGSASPINVLPTAVIDDLFKRANATLDEKERIALTRQIVNTAYEAAVAVPIAASGAIYGASKSVTNWTPVKSSGGLAYFLEDLRPAPR